MSRNPSPPIFLQRASYRQRRLRDAARLMPFLGAVLWAIPLSWQTAEDGSDVGTSGLIYIFSVWVLLILLTAIFASRVKGENRTDDYSGTGAQ